MEKKLLLIINPVAGKGRIKMKLFNIIELFEQYEYEVTVYITKCKADGEVIAAERGSDFDRIVCSGGDGTLNEVVNGIMSLEGKHPPLGYIPAGTTNDFSVTLKLPMRTMDAAKRAVTGTEFTCDLGIFNKRHFVYTAAFGAFSDLSYITPTASKNLLGRTAYVLQGIERLSAIKPSRLSVDINGSIIEGDFIFGMVTNTESVGGFKGVTGKNVSLNDGLLEVVLISMPKKAADLQNIAKAFLTKNLNEPGIYTFKSDSLTIKCNDEVAWTLDGEFGGSPTEVRIKTLHNAITYIV